MKINVAKTLFLGNFYLVDNTASSPKALCIFCRVIFTQSPLPKFHTHPSVNYLKKIVSGMVKFPRIA